LNFLGAERPDDVDRLTHRVDPEQSAIREPGILGLEIDDELAGRPPSLRLASGALVAACIPDPHAADVSLSAGDVIHAVNGRPIATPFQLWDALDELSPHSSVVLQVERDGVCSFVAFELD
jgi:S1-C subfamily serine protease